MTGNATVLLLGTVFGLERLSTKTGKPWIKLLLEIKTYRHATEGSPAQEEVTKVPVNLFSKVAATAEQYLQQGDAVAITARVQGSEYSDKATGTVRYGVTLTADVLHLLPNGRAGQGKRATTAAAPRASAPSGERDWSRKPNMQPVGRNENNEPLDIGF